MNLNDAFDALRVRHEHESPEFDVVGVEPRSQYARLNAVELVGEHFAQLRQIQRRDRHVQRSGNLMNDA